MSVLRLFDSLVRRKVDFVPREPGKVRMYCCGPTVQGSPHVGHARTFTAMDVVARYLRWSGLDVTFVRNVTDIDDKIIKKAAEAGVSPAEHAARYDAEFRAEMLALGNLPPDLEPRVTRTIPQIVALIDRLVANGKAYPARGDVYYAVDSFPAYGRLSGQSIDDLQAGARVEPGEQKKNPLDFALWKAGKPGEPQWDSPWGPGRPGWHIECSAMILDVLGETIDIHAGGKDLVFPHHENEIAQSQGVLGPDTFVRHWLHVGFVNFNDEKMSKSLGNVFLVSDLRGRYDGESIRLFILGTHYRSPINFEVIEKDGRAVFPGLDDAERRLDYFYTTLARLGDAGVPATLADEAGPVIPEAAELTAKIHAAMDDDFNTAVALAELGEAAKAANKLLDEPKGVAKDVRRRSLARLARDLHACGTGALGLLGKEPRAFLHARRARLCAARQVDPGAIDARLAERAQARQAKDFARGDAIRAELRTLGIEVMDTPRGAEWRINE